MAQNSSKCHKCGQDNSKDLYYCEKCGAFIRVQGATVPKFNRHFRAEKECVSCVSTDTISLGTSDQLLSTEFKSSPIQSQNNTSVFYDLFENAVSQVSYSSFAQEPQTYFDPIHEQPQEQVSSKQPVSIDSAPENKCEVVHTANKYIICNVCGQKIDYENIRPKRCPKCQNHELHRCAEFDMSISEDVFVTENIPASNEDERSQTYENVQQTIESTADIKTSVALEQHEQTRRRIKHIEVDNSILKLICMKDDTTFDIPQNGCIIGSEGTLNADWFSNRDGVHPMHIQIIHYPSGWYMKTVCDALTRYNGNLTDRDVEIKLENNSFITMGSITFTVMVVKL